MWYVYIAITSRGNLYTGVSTDPRRRVSEHNYTKRGAKCLRGQRPVKLVWMLKMSSKSIALQTEQSIKQKSRMEKLALLLEDNLQLLLSLDEIEELLLK